LACIIISSCWGKADDSFDEEFSFARSVVSTRAIFSESAENYYREPLAKLFAGEEAMDQARVRSRFALHGRNEVDTVVVRHMLIDQLLYDAVGQAHGPRQVVILEVLALTPGTVDSLIFLFVASRLTFPNLPNIKRSFYQKHGLDHDLKAATRIQLDLTSARLGGSFERGWLGSDDSYSVHT